MADGFTAAAFGPTVARMSGGEDMKRIRRIYDRRPSGAPGSDRDARLHWLCSRVRGEVLEVGIGRGRTLPYYPAGIHLTGVDISPVSLAAASERARSLGLNASLREADASDLPFASGHFDTVVFCFALCTIPDDRRAVAEAVRVLQPGGSLLLLEHVRSPNRLVRAVERVLQPLTLRFMADHLLREPLDRVLAEGLDVEELERNWFGVIERLCASKPELEELAQAV